MIFFVKNYDKKLSMHAGKIKFRHLQCLLAIAELRSLKKAAATLAITQPAVSKTISELEAILETRLFERGRAGADLTKDGKVFLAYAQASVDAVHRGASLITKSGEAAAEMIRIGASPSLAPSFIPEALLRLRQLVDGMQVSFVDGATLHLIDLLRRSELDFVICRHFAPDRMVGLSFEFLYADPLLAVVRPGHPLLADADITTTALRAYTAVLPISGSMNRHAADTLTYHKELGPVTDFIESLSTSLSRTYTLRSDSVWFVPWSAVNLDLETGELIRLPFPNDSTPNAKVIMARSIGLMVRTDSVMLPAVQTVTALIRQIAAERRALIL